MKYINFLKQNKKVVFALLGCITLMGLACLALYYPMMDFFKNPSVVKQQLEGYGFFGECILTLVMALQVVFVFLPGEIIEVLAGFIYGPIEGMIVCLIGAAIGSIIIYVFVQKLGLLFIDKLIGKEKLEQVSFLKNQERLGIALFIIFFIPGTPKDIITYFMPLTNMSLPKFLLITTVARIPSVITSTIGGNALGMAEYEFMAIVFIVTGLFSLAGLLFYKAKFHQPAKL